MKIKDFFWQAFAMALFFGLLCLPVGNVLGVDEDIVDEVVVEEVGALLPELGLYMSYEGVGFLNIRIVDKQLRVYFTDDEKKLIIPTYRSARVKYEGVRNKDKEGAMRLNLDGGGLFLFGRRKLFPPYFLWVKLVLLDESNSDNNKYFTKTRLRQ